MGNQYFIKYCFWFNCWRYYVFYDKIKIRLTPDFIFTRRPHGQFLIIKTCQRVFIYGNVDASLHYLYIDSFFQDFHCLVDAVNILAACCSECLLTATTALDFLSSFSNHRAGIPFTFVNE